MRILLFAGTHAQARDFAFERKLNPTSWRYLGQLRDILGCSSGSRRPRVLLIGTVRERPDYATLRQALEVRNALFLTPETFK